LFFLLFRSDFAAFVLALSKSKASEKTSERLAKSDCCEKSFPTFKKKEISNCQR